MSEDNSPEDKDRSEAMAETPAPDLGEDPHRVEMLKLQFEWHKHLTTLTSGIILLVATLSYTVFRDAAGVAHPFPITLFGINILLILAFILFFSLWGWSLHAMRRVIFLVATPGARSSERYVKLRYALTVFCLVGGLLAFVVFVILTRSS